MADEREERLGRHRAYLAEQAAEELQQNAPLIAKFRQECQDRGIGMTDDDFSYVLRIGIVAGQPGLVSSLHPELSVDKDGLHDFGQLVQLYSRKRFASGYLYGEWYMLMAHPYFRRGFHPQAAFAPRFVELFWALEEAGIRKFIALDTDRVRVNVDNRMYMERDTWYGAKFKKDIRAIPDDVIKMAPPSDLRPFDVSFLFNDVCALDMKWLTQGPIKSFYAEEFNVPEITISWDGAEYHPARYIHAEFDLNKGEFRHFDGSLHFYTPEDYAVRVSSDLNHNEKNSRPIKPRSQKLFRMDGGIPINIWMEFMSHFFTGNPLVFEYFEGAFPTHTEEMIEILRKNPS